MHEVYEKAMIKNNNLIHKNIMKNLLFIIFGLMVLSLLILGFFLKYQIGIIKKNNQKNIVILNQAFPGFNSKIVEHLKEEVDDTKAQIKGLSNYFSTQEKGAEKDYNLSIYFVEDLSKVKQFLKGKAEEKQLKYPELDYKGKLPSEAEAVYSLNQLHGLKEVLSLGMDYGINFKSVLPNTAMDLDNIAEMRLLRSKIEFSCLPQALIEFIIGLYKINPSVFIESLSLTSSDSSLEVNLTLNHVVIEPFIFKGIELLKFNQGEKEITTSSLQDISIKETSFFKILRSNNPFVTVAPPEKEGYQTQPKSGAGGVVFETKPGARYLYKGRGILRLKEVAIIEDTMAKEVFFLGKNEKLDKFILEALSDGEIILKNLDDGQEVILKR